MTARRRARRRPAADALIIFAKAPEPGQVKTRLSPPLTSDQAARLHAAFVLDGVRATHRLPASITRWLACAPSSQHPFFERLAPRRPPGGATPEGGPPGGPPGPGPPP